MSRYLQSELPGTNKIIYFSDGRAAMYKNCKNFLNLCHHEEDFKIKAEWNFFTTSHSKGPCDGTRGHYEEIGLKGQFTEALQ